MAVNTHTHKKYSTVIELQFEIKLQGICNELELTGRIFASAKLYLRASPPIDPFGLNGALLPKDTSLPANERLVTIFCSRSLFCFRFIISCRILFTVSLRLSSCDAELNASNRMSVKTRSFSRSCFFRSSTMRFSSSMASIGLAFSTTGTIRCGEHLVGDSGGNVILNSPLAFKLIEWLEGICSSVVAALTYRLPLFGNFVLREKAFLNDVRSQPVFLRFLS